MTSCSLGLSYAKIELMFLRMNLACAAPASLIKVEVTVLPGTLGNMLGPRPLPALTTGTGLLDAVPKPEVAF